MAEHSEQALKITATLTQCALETANELKRQLSALRRVSLMLRDADIGGGGITDADVLALMETSRGLLDRRGESLAAHLQQQAISAYRRVPMEAPRP